MTEEQPPNWPDGASNVRPFPKKPIRQQTPALDWITLAGQEPPARQWAIKGWLGYGHVTLLIGSGGIGKTLIAQQLGSCLAIGRSPFIDDIPAQAKVLMWACEDDHDELWRRQIAISRWLKTGLDSFNDLVLIPRLGCDNQICTSEFGRLTFTDNLLQLKEQASDLQAKVIILDNVAQIYGASENDRPSVTAFLNALCGALPNTAILLLGHPSRGLNSEFSGSSAWENVARTRLYLGASLPDQKRDADDERTDNDNIRYLARRKGNYSSKDWRKCLFKDGVLQPEEVESGIVDSIRHSNAEKAVIAGIRTLAERFLYPTDGKSTDRFLPKMFAAYKVAEDYSRDEIAQAMRRLIMDGKIEKAECGRGSDRHPQLGLRVVESSGL